MAFVEERGAKTWKASILDDEINGHGPTRRSTQ